MEEKQNKDRETLQSNNKYASKFNFEVAMEEIKNIAKAIEQGDLPLDESINKYEHALKLIKQCQNLLQSASQKIEQISQANENNNDR